MRIIACKTMLQHFGLEVLAYLMGNYYFSKATYEKLFDWTDEHKFKTGKYSYKEAVIDELAQPLPVNI